MNDILREYYNNKMTNKDKSHYHFKTINKEDNTFNIRGFYKKQYIIDSYIKQYYTTNNYRCAYVVTFYEYFNNCFNGCALIECLKVNYFNDKIKALKQPHIKTF